MDFDPNEVVGQPFMYEVGGSARPPEHWCEEVLVFHNPGAALAVPRDFFSPFGQRWRVGGKDETRLHSFYPHWSITDVIRGNPSRAARERIKAARGKLLIELAEEANRVVRTRMIFRGDV